MNKNQEDNLKRQLKELRRKNKELQEGLDQIMGTVDAILIRLGQTFGEDREDGWHLEITAPKLTDLEEYEVKTAKDFKGDDSYRQLVIGVFRKPAEGGKPPDGEAQLQ